MAHTRGIVKDVSDSTVIVGASVKIVGTKIGVSTDGDGCFDLEYILDRFTVEVSCIGYITQNFTVYTGRNNEIYLSPDSSD